MNKHRVIILIILFLLLAASTYYKLSGNHETGITATGTIEITLVDVAPKVAGNINDLLVESGERITKNQKIAQISRPDLKAQLLRDEAALAKAESQLTDLKKGFRNQELQSAKANLASAQAVFDKSKADYERFKALYEQGAVSAQQLDSIRTSMDVAASSLQAVQSQLSLIQEGNRADIIIAQVKEVDRNRAILEASQSSYADTVITAPQSGIIISKNYEKGEFVNIGAPIITIGDYKDCWVKVYISSAQLGLIKVGQNAGVQVDSFPGKTFHGVIKEISQKAEFTPRQSITQQERANLVFAVKVKVDNGEAVLKPGMPADVILR